VTAPLDAPLPADWRREPPGPRALRADVVLALGLLGAYALSLLLSSSLYPADEVAPMWVWALFAAANALPLAVRRRWPEAVALVCAAAFAGAQLLRVPEALVSNLTLFIALFTLGAWGADRMRAAVVRWVIIAAMFVWVFLTLIFPWSVPAVYGELEDSGVAGPLPPGLAAGLINIVINLLYFGGAYYFGDRAFAAARQRAALDERTAELVSERERSARTAVALERLRIARELHDVVAHHVAVMGVQAGAARRVLARDPAQASASLEAVESGARDAVDELRQMLGTLRSEGADADGPVPDGGSAAAGGAPGEDTAASPSTRRVDRLPELVDAARAAGREARLTVVGAVRELPPTVDLVAFRVAQEAVTNALKHAGASAAVDLRLRYLPEAVELEVSDSGRGARRADGAAGAGAGLGQIGMRERVAAVGGRLETGPRDRGGYLVRARLPVPPGATT